jgi:hypothetical protein
VERGGPVITYDRVGGRPQPGEPADDEHLRIDGSSFELTRRSDAPAVGRFAGTLDAATVEELDRLAGAVTASVDGARRPDAAAVEIRAGDRIGRFGQGSGPGSWAALERRLEQLAGDLVDQPAAAIALEVAEDGSAARLVHAGSDPVDVDLSEVRVHAFLWKGYYEPAGEWRAEVRGGPERAEPGWAHELPFAHGLALGGDTTLQADVVFGLDGAPAKVVHAPPIAPPS